MIKVGVTGGIGSGKSLICKVFLKMGIPVYTADDEAKYLMDHDPEIKTGLSRIFGETIYTDGKLNRSKLAGLIFDDASLLAEVNRIVHPVVGQDFLNWCSAHSRFPFVIQESAIIFESQAFSLFDYIILVTAPEEIRLQRVLDRPGMTSEKILRIMRNQLPEKEKIVRSHFVIKNDGTNLILPHILSVYTEISKKIL